MKHYLLFLFVSGLALAQPTPAITTVQTLAEILNLEAKNIQFPLLSPDGSMISFDDGTALCIHKLETTNTHCHEYPEDFGDLGNFSTIVWSPDSTQLIFTESFFDLFVDADLWQFDVPNKTFNNLTNDGIDFFDPSATFSLDVLPGFHPKGTLYFVRSEPQGNPEVSLPDRLSLELSIYSPSGITTVKTLYPRLKLTGLYKSFSISPSGKLIAFIVLYPDARENKTNSGIYILDLDTNWLSQVLDLTVIEPYLPKNFNGNMFPQQIVWAGNQGLIVRFANIGYKFPMLEGHALYLDLGTKKVTALEDFSTYSATEVLNQSQDDSSLYNRVPLTGLVLSDKNTYLYASLDVKRENLFIWSQTMPFGQTPSRLLKKIALPELGYGETETHLFPAMFQTSPSLSHDGKKLLIFGHLLTLE